MLTDVSTPVSALPERPDAPAHLTAEESTLWREVVATRPADWFMRDTQPVLAAYCQAVVMHRELIETWRKTDFVLDRQQYKTIVGLVNTTAGTISQLATKLRLTQQSRYTPSSAATASKRSGPVKPWENAKG